jgi:hypothetical protein
MTITIVIRRAINNHQPGPDRAKGKKKKINKLLLKTMAFFINSINPYLSDKTLQMYSKVTLYLSRFINLFSLYLLFEGPALPVPDVVNSSVEPLTFVALVIVVVDAAVVLDEAVELAVLAVELFKAVVVLKVVVELVSLDTIVVVVFSVFAFAASGVEGANAWEFVN